MWSSVKQSSFLFLQRVQSYVQLGMMFRWRRKKQQSDKIGSARQVVLVAVAAGDEGEDYYLFKVTGEDKEIIHKEWSVVILCPPTNVKELQYEIRKRSNQPKPSLLFHSVLQQMSKNSFIKITKKSNYTRDCKKTKRRIGKRIEFESYLGKKRSFLTWIFLLVCSLGLQ